MVGSIGMVRGLSRPNSLVIQEALNLLSALGGDGKGVTKKLLTEMKDIQDNNATALEFVKAEITNSNKRTAEVTEREAKLSRDVLEAEELYSTRLSVIENGEEDLQRKTDEINVWISEEDGRISKLEDELGRDRKEYQESLSESNEALAQKLKILKEDRGNLKEYESSIKDREEDVKSEETILNVLRESLNERSTKLDLRDSRVREAMKDEDVD